jgi:hypothetical protein
LANARFSHHDFEAMAAHWNADDFAMAKVLAYRTAAMTPPHAPTLADQAALAAQPGPWMRNSPAAQIDEWVRKICAHRDAFRGCAIIGTVGGENRAFVVLFATQKPLEVALSPLHPIRKVMPNFRALPLADQRAWVQNHYDHDYSVQLGVSQLYSHGLFDEGQDIEVLHHAHYMSGLRFCSHVDPVLLDDFCASLPPAPLKKSSSSRQKGPNKETDPDLLKMYPWLETYASQRSSLYGESYSAVPEPELPVLEPTEFDEELVRKTWALLEERRREWAEEDKVHTTDFETFIRGGTWVQTHRGTAFDCIIGRPCNDTAKQWIQMYFQHKTAAFAYKKYGEQAANMLALGWCHRMQHLFNLYADSSDRPYCYQQVEIDAYQPEPAYSEWLAKLPAGSPAFVRHQELVLVLPTYLVHRGSAASSSYSGIGAQLASD